MLFCDCVQDYFRTFLMRQRGYGANTIGSYRDTFRLLLAYMDEIGLSMESLEMADMDRGTVTGFLCWLESSRGNVASTRNVRLAHIKSFASYIATVSPEDVGTCAAIRSIPSKRQRSSPPESLSKDEVGCLLATPGTDTRKGLRESALLALLYDSACRAQELADMDVNSVTTGRVCHARIDGKGNKRRTVPLLRETGELVSAYIESFGLPRDSPLFLNRSGHRLTRSGVSDVVERNWRRVKENHPEVAMHDNAKPHILRHSKATHLVEAGVSIYHVRDFLGHESVNTTMVYLKHNPEKMREIVEAASDGLAKAATLFYAQGKKEELLSFLETLT